MDTPKNKVSAWKLEPYAKLFGFLNWLGTTSFAGVSCFLAYERGLSLGGAETPHCLNAATVLLSLALAYAVQKRYVRVLHGYVTIIALLYAAAVIYVIVMASLQAAAGSSWLDIFPAFGNRLPVLGFLLLSMFCLKHCCYMTRSAAKIKEMSEMMSEMFRVYYSNV